MARGSLHSAPLHASEHEGFPHDPGEDDPGPVAQGDHDVAGHRLGPGAGGRGDALDLAGGATQEGGHLVWAACAPDLSADQTGEQRVWAAEA